MRRPLLMLQRLQRLLLRATALEGKVAARAHRPVVVVHVQLVAAAARRCAFASHHLKYVQTWMRHGKRSTTKMRP